jgi:putative photosynthetic complex assembly protein 2
VVSPGGVADAMVGPVTPALLPVVVAVAVWWSATGLILLVDGLPPRTHRLSLGVATRLALAALGGLVVTAGIDTPAAAYIAFGCALTVWGWQELAFLTGWITGPRRVASDAGDGRLRLFAQAVGAVLYHELAIAAGGIAVCLATLGGVNRAGVWTYTVLWAMRTSAKLNLHFGVRNLGIEMLPPRLAYLAGYFRRRPMNAFLPLSLLLSGWVLARIVGAHGRAINAGEATGLALAGALLGLAIVEHLMLVMPITPSAPWRWALRGERAGAPPARRSE